MSTTGTDHGPRRFPQGWALALLLAGAGLLAGCDRLAVSESTAAAEAAETNAAVVLTPEDLADIGMTTITAGSGPELPRITAEPLTTAEIPVPEPDASTAEASVQARIRERRAAFDRSLTTNTVPASRAEAWGGLGMFYFAYQFPAAATACFTNAVFHAPGDHRSWYGLAECLFEEDDFAGAVATMDVALQQMMGSTNATPADQISARRFMGDALERLGRVAEARQQFEAVLVLEPRDIYSLVKGGQLMSQSGGGPAALSYFESALKRAPRNQTIVSLLAQEYRRNGMTNRAAQLGKRLGEGLPQASALVRPDPWRQFVAQLVDSPTMFVRRGNQFARRRQPGRAIAAYEAALRLDPTNNTAGINLTSALLSAGRLNDARRVIEEVADRGDASEELRYNLALARIFTGATNEALAVVEQWRQERPNEPLALQLEGVVREKMGDLPGTEAALQQYLKLKPGSPPVSARLARLQARDGRAEAARTTLEEGLRQMPNHPGLAHQLARLLALNPRPEIRNPARAVELMKPLMGARPGLARIETQLLALTAAGDDKAATQRFRQLTNSLSKATNAVLKARVGRLASALAAGQSVQEPWPFALNSTKANPDGDEDDDAPAPAP